MNMVTNPVIGGASWFSLVSCQEKVFNKKPVTILCDAAASGDLALCRWVHQVFNLTPVEARGNHGYPLCMASANGHLSVCQWLHATFNLTAKDARTDLCFALRWSATNGHVNVCKWLVDTFHLNAKDVRAHENFALVWATRHGHIDVCRWLTQFLNVEDHKTEKSDIRNSLCWALQTNNVVIVDWMEKTLGLTANDIEDDRITWEEITPDMELAYIQAKANAKKLAPLPQLVTPKGCLWTCSDEECVERRERYYDSDDDNDREFRHCSNCCNLLWEHAPTGNYDDGAYCDACAREFCAGCRYDNFPAPGAKLDYGGDNPFICFDCLPENSDLRQKILARKNTNNIVDRE